MPVSFSFTIFIILCINVIFIAWEDPCQPNPCHGWTESEKSVCKTQKYPLPSTFFCRCELGLGGPTCDTIIDPCLSTPCQGGSTCITINTSDPISFECSCAFGLKGDTCEQETGK